MSSASERRTVRVGLVAAVGFLLLDAALLALAGCWSARVVFFIWGAVFLVGAVLVIAIWRRYVAHLGELDAARREARSEVEKLRVALKGRQG